MTPNDTRKKSVVDWIW